MGWTTSEEPVRQYLELLDAVMSQGEDRDDRTGVGTRSLFGWQSRYDLADGFPLLTTKRVHTRSIIVELLWFLAGRTDNGWLNDRGVTIWDEWSTAEQTARFDRPAGELGPTYGHQWRNFGATPLGDGTYADDGVDQLARVVSEIRTNPSSRRLVVSGWHAGEADQVALPPCHTLFQFHVGTDGRLSCQLYQRSADLFLGVPFNIASYALLTHMVAQVCDLRPGVFVHTFGDVHLYRNHFEQVRLQLGREPKALPRLVLDPTVRELDDFTLESITVEGYDPAPGIPAPVAV
jgi:thymidylate synthase